MRKRVEMMARSTSAKNGQERVVNDRDNAKHLEYFMNGQWRHSNNCKDFTNKECTFKIVKSNLDQTKIKKFKVINDYSGGGLNRKILNSPQIYSC